MLFALFYTMWKRIIPFNTLCAAASSSSCIGFHPKRNARKIPCPKWTNWIVSILCANERDKHIHTRAHCMLVMPDVLSSIWMLLTIMCMPHWHTNRIRVWIKYPLTYFNGGCSSTFHTIYRTRIYIQCVFFICHLSTLRHALLIHYVTDYNSLMLFISLYGTFTVPLHLFLLANDDDEGYLWVYIHLIRYG